MIKKLSTTYNVVHLYSCVIKGLSGYQKWVPKTDCLNNIIFYSVPEFRQKGVCNKLFISHSHLTKASFLS